MMMLLTSMTLPVIGASAFWQAYLPTILLGANNLSGFVGRNVAATPPEAGARWPFACAVFAPAGLGLALAYARADGDVPMLAPSNWNAVALFSTIALLVGYTMIVLSQLTHSVCGHSHQAPCPIVAQINFLSMNLGALAATVVSSSGKL